MNRHENTARPISLPEIDTRKIRYQNAYHADASKTGTGFLVRVFGVDSC